MQDDSSLKTIEACISPEDKLDLGYAKMLLQGLMKGHLHG